MSQSQRFHAFPFDAAAVRAAGAAWCPESATWDFPDGSCARELSGDLIQWHKDPHQQIVVAACCCARRALRYVPVGEMRPLRAIEAAEEWARNPTKVAVAAAAAARSACSAAAAVDAAEHSAMCTQIRAQLVLPWSEGL